MFSYTAYGLIIYSDRHLPELTENLSLETGNLSLEEADKQDILICNRCLTSVSDTILPIAAGTPSWRWVSPGEAFLSWEGVGSFLVRYGREVYVDAASDVSDATVRLFLLGPVLAMLLHQRGLLVLHASAVSVNGSVVGFLGNSGQGKSTTARMLHERGHHFVADDVIAVFCDLSGNFLVYPGIFQFKLWPESASAMGDDPEELPRLRPEYDKRARRVAPTLALHEALPLRRLYVLGQGDRHSIVPIIQKEAVFQLLAHTYTRKMLVGEALAQHFKQCVQLVKTVPVCRLERKHSLVALPEIADLIEKDVDQCTPFDAGCIL